MGDFECFIDGKDWVIYVNLSVVFERIEDGFCMDIKRGFIKICCKVFIVFILNIFVSEILGILDVVF